MNACSMSRYMVPLLCTQGPPCMHVGKCDLVVTAMPRACT